MCGILGELRFDGCVDPADFSRMLSELESRGPDAAGTRRFKDGRVMLGHRRLSIIDLSDAATQPMTNEDGTIWLVFNGEIYNYKSLRQTLAAAGHTFRTRSDSEVIIHAYEQWRERCVDHLRGMFAFAIWDGIREQLFLARDHLGIKPLYYWRTDDRLVFASQPRAIIRHSQFSRRINVDALQNFLAYRYVPGELSIFSGVKKLAAGHYVIADPQTFVSRRYWSVSYRPAVRDLEEATDLVYQGIERAVARQLVSDVPIGIWLSGGIDSSSIGAIAASRMDALPCFTIGFEEKAFDERRFAHLAARAVGLEVREHTLTMDGMVELLPDIVDTYDEPFFDHSAVPTCAISRLTKENDIKVILSGDGGDELFAGYTWYDQLSSRHGLLSSLVRKWNLPLRRIFQLVGYLDSKFQKRLVNSHTGFNHLALLKKHFDPDVPIVTAMQIIDINCFLVDDILTKVDRASMACGVEVRVPLLDLDLVESAFTIDHEILYRHGERKFLMKRAMSRLLSRDVLTARKKGFSIPLEIWMRRGIGRLAEQLLTEGFLVGEGVLRHEGVRQILGSNRWDWKWLLLTSEMWARQWIAGEQVGADRIKGLLEPKGKPLPVCA